MRKREIKCQFAPLPDRLLDEAECPADLALYAVLAREWKKPESCKPESCKHIELGTAKICERSRVSKPTALARLEWLRQRGFVEFGTSGSHSQRRTYRLPDLDGTGKSENRSTIEPVNLETGQDEAPEPVNSETGTGQLENHVLRREERKTKSLRAKRERGPADLRHSEFKEAVADYWASRNPNHEMPWDGSEARALASLLSASPALTADRFRDVLRNRYRSAVNHAERPRKWLGNALSFAGGPLDRFGQPLEGANGNANRNYAKTSGNRAALETVAAELDLDVGATHGLGRGAPGGDYAGDLEALRLPPGRISA